MIELRLASVFVDDQDKALKFYTGVVGFVKKTEIPLEKAKWLTVASPAGPDGVELLLEPNDNPIAKTYQKRFSKQHPCNVLCFRRCSERIRTNEKARRGVQYEANKGGTRNRRRL